MGRAIVSAAKNHPDFDVVLEYDAGDRIDGEITAANVMIDFSHADAATEVCRAATQFQLATIIGTTGHSPEQKKAIEDAGRKVPIVYTSNFSVGVNVLFDLATRAAESLGGNFDVRIVETHHIRKKDAPSGTAKTLAEGIRAKRPGCRPIAIESVREGDVVGDHTVFLSGPGERLELTHQAASREIFALGALRAAEWVVGKAPGVYSMRDVLAL